MLDSVMCFGEKAGKGNRKCWVRVLRQLFTSQWNSQEGLTES